MMGSDLSQTTLVAGALQMRVVGDGSRIEWRDIRHHRDRQTVITLAPNQATELNGGGELEARQRGIAT